MNYLLTVFLLSFIGYTFAEVCSDVNEEYKSCGTACPRTCADPRKNRMCIAVCKSGCFCKEPYIRDQSSGKCVLLEKCAKTCTHEHESYTECGSKCPVTCANLNQTGRVCPDVCVEGCFCEKPYIRDNTFKCVLSKDCPQAMDEVMCADKNALYKECGTACPKTCANKDKNIICTEQCVQGCFCRDGYVKDKSGKCVLTRDCPQAMDEVMCADQNAIYNACGTACPKTCATKDKNIICTEQCVQGCFCKAGYVKESKTGKCVLTRDCPQTPKPFAEDLCADPNSSYKECGTACPRTCANKDRRIICTEQCVQGCFCKDPYVKESKTGKCVLTRDCPQLDEEVCADPQAVYKQCGTACPITCKNHLNPPKFCTLQCKTGCFCQSPYIKDESTGRCVLPDACPAIATTVSF